MVNDSEHFRIVLLFYFRKGENAVQARKKLCTIYGEDVLSERQYQNWFSKFRSGNIDLEAATRSGRPIKVEDDKIKVFVDAERHIIKQEIAEQLKLSNSIVHDNLKRLGTEIFIFLFLLFQDIKFSGFDSSVNKNLYKFGVVP